MIGNPESIGGIEQAGNTRLSSFLTLAAVLLRAQSRQVVAQLVVNAAADLCPRLTFSALCQPGLLENEPDLLTAQTRGVLLSTLEAEGLKERLFALLPVEVERPVFIPDTPAPAELQTELPVKLLSFAPALTPTQFYGWLVAGSLEYLDSEENYYLRSLAQLAAIAFENAARFEELKESAAETTLVNEVAGALATSLNAEELFQTFMTYLRNLLLVERAGLALLSADRSQYEMPYSWTDGPGRVRRGYVKNLPLAGSILEKVIREREILINPLQDTDGLDNNFFKVMDGSRMVVPLLAKGQPIGALLLASRSEKSYRENEPRLLLVEKLSRLFALALVNSQLYEEKQLSAEFDSRVGVYNHDYFDRELAVQVEKARRLGYKLGLIMVDMDNLKMVNDRYGHLAGDAALRHIATLVSGTVRATDVVARYGGDEFGVMLPGCTARSLEIVSEKARRTVRSTPLLLENGEQIQLTVSVGAALFPEDAEGPVELIQRADAAMYEAKKRRDEARIGRRARLAKVSERELARGAPRSAVIQNEEEIQASIDIDSLSAGRWAASDYERFLNWLGGDRPTVVANVLRETYKQLAEANHQLHLAQNQISHLEEGLRHGLQMVALVVEGREPYLAGGAEKLRRLCLLLARELNYNGQQIAELEVAAWLANVGRLTVPEYIWSKIGHLSAYDWRWVKQVPLEGAKLAEKWKPVVTPGAGLAIRHQRERFDGLGYPNGLAGEEIPIQARILGLAGAIVALHQPRPFRPKQSLAAIRSEIEQAAGRHFDPELARIMLYLIDQGQLSFLE